MPGEKKRSTNGKTSKPKQQTNGQKTLLELFMRKPRVEAQEEEEEETPAATPPPTTTDIAEPHEGVDSSEPIILATHTSMEEAEPPTTENIADSELPPPIPLRGTTPPTTLSTPPLSPPQSSMSTPPMFAGDSAMVLDLTSELETAEIHSQPTGSTREDAIVLDKSPVKLKAPGRAGSSAGVYSIFSARPRAKPVVAPIPLTPETTPTVPPKKSRPAFKRASTKLTAPYPHGGTQHVCGPQSKATMLTQPSFPKRVRMEGEPLPSSLPDYLLKEDKYEAVSRSPIPFVLSPIVSQEQRDAAIGSIPIDHLNMPAISRLTTAALTNTTTSSQLPISTSTTSTPNTTMSASSDQLWTDKWHPSRSEEVLWNHPNAVFLSQWLRAQELHLPVAPSTTVGGAGIRTSSDSSQPCSNPSQSSKRKDNSKANSRGTKRSRTTTTTTTTTTIIRSVEKKRGRKKRRVDSDEDWIVYSDEDEQTSEANGFIDGAVGGEDDDDADFPDPASFHSVRSGGGQQLPFMEADIAGTGSTLNPAAAAPGLERSSRPFFRDRLTNTILLAGPPGSGKTASVYACAEELGWEVFEVYPGIGRRNGASVENLIGEVGRNHLVRKSNGYHHQHQQRPLHPHPNLTLDSQLGLDPQKGPRGQAETNLTTNQERDGQKGDISPLDSNENNGHAAAGGHVANENERSVVADQEESKDSRLSVDFGFVGMSEGQTNDEATESTPSVRQSLILLEEVDILFKEDVNFWATVTNFIKECKRPVVFTCNDLTLIPTLDLPLQTVLHYQPCPPPVAVSYLQSMCIAEGYFAERETLHQWYETGFQEPSSSTIAPDCYWNLSPTSDLRKAINCVQFWCRNSDQAPVSPRLSSRAIPTPPPTSTTHALGTNSHQGPYAGPQLAERQNDMNGDHAGQRSNRFATNHFDLMSFVDSHLQGGEFFKDSEMGSEWSSADEEIGHTVLKLSGSDRVGGGFGLSCEEDGNGYVDRQGQIASSAIRHSRGGVEIEVVQVNEKGPMSNLTKDSFEPRALTRARVDYQMKIALALRNQIAATVRVTSERAFHLDYGPWVREIVAGEDEQEREWMSSREGKVGRSTRNSQRYTRNIVLNDEERWGLIKSEF